MPGYWAHVGEQALPERDGFGVGLSTRKIVTPVGSTQFDDHGRPVGGDAFLDRCRSSGVMSGTSSAWVFRVAMVLSARVVNHLGGP